MTDEVQFQPEWLSPPGDTISDILESRNLPLEGLAAQLNSTPDEIRGLLDGSLPITLAKARALHFSLGASVEFWMCRDAHYREERRKLFDIQVDWLDELPVNDMFRLGWLSPGSTRLDTFEACLRFFGIASVPAWRSKYSELHAMAMFRKSAAFDSKPGAVAAWLRQGELEAHRLSCGSWDPTGFRHALLKIRPLTRKRDPRHFVPALQSLCGLHGVAVVVVPTPSGCPASGATRFLDPNKALLMLSARHLSDDHFWFSFFHEAGHILLHNPRNVILEEPGHSATTIEAEANAFAERVLIPESWRAHMLSLPAQPRAIIAFAKKLDVAPGIIVGQLQHHKVIDHSRLNSLRRRFSWHL